MGRIADALAKAEKERKELGLATEHSTPIVASRDVSGIDPHIVSYTDPQCTIAEQYRMLRTNLFALNSGPPVHSVVVTSAIKGEGKTVTSLNLATVMATDTEKKIAVVDCDLRRPNMHTLLNMELQPGLSEFLRGEATLDAVSHKGKIPNLTIITAGRPPMNPSELVGSRKMAETVNELKKQFDFVVFDTPPIMAVTDAGLLGAIVDGVLLVVRAESTKRDLVRRAETLLRGAKARVVGCVLTNIKEYTPYYIYGYSAK
ncbi:MAG: CpsD/CapB family tyrosine-protein kinase [bacterium]|nr:CpsD/CapB family tyrosine-protein kinase [bacterium]